jgi:hypothetical protein
MLYRPDLSRLEIIEEDTMKTKKFEVRKKGLWSCPQCKKQHLGFQRGNVCSVCKTRLVFSVEEATLTTCQKCQNLFNFDKQPGASSGHVKCPRCKATVNENGHLVGKQEDAQKLSKFRGAKPRLPDSSSACRLCGECGKCGKERQKGAGLDKEVHDWTLNYFTQRLRG